MKIIGFKSRPVKFLVHKVAHIGLRYSTRPPLFAYISDCQLFYSNKSYVASVVDFLHDAYSGTKNEDKDKILWVKFENIDTKGWLAA